MKILYTLFFFFMMTLTSCASLAQETQHFSFTANCTDTTIQVPQQAYQIKIVGVEGASIQLKQYDYASRFAVTDERTIEVSKRYRLKTSKFYDVVLNACDSTCKEVFVPVLDSKDVLLEDDEASIVVAFDSMHTTYNLVGGSLVVEYWSEIYPNPTASINNTVDNMRRAGLEPVRWFTLLGQELSVHEVQRMQEGTVVCEYAYRLPTGHIQLNSVKIVLY